MIEHNLSDESEVPNKSRRNFLRQFLPKRSPATEVSPLQKNADKLTTELNKAQVSRRRFLAASTGAGGALALEHFLNKLPTALMKRFLANPEQFLSKLAEKIQKGQIGDEIHQALDSRIGTHGTVEIGEKVDISENWISQCFSEYEVRKSVRDGDVTNQLILIAKPAQVKPVHVHFDPLAEGTRLQMSNFTHTMEENAPCATLPSNQVEWDSSKGIFTPYLYSAYQLEDGSIVEFKEKDGLRRDRGGALIVVDGRLQVIADTEAKKYRVGENACMAIETMSFTISSETKAADLLTINNTEILSGAHLADSPRFDSIIVTFKGNKNTKDETFILSTYQHLDDTTLQISGKRWDPFDRMTLIQASEMCDQLMAEKGFTSYVIAVPDPEEQSRIVSSETFTQVDAQKLRQKGVELAVPTQIRGEQFGQKAHRTVGMYYPIDTIRSREYFLITQNS